MEAAKDSYLILGTHASAEIKVKGSRFIAEAIPVSSVEAAEAELLAIKKRDYNATHHCSAYKIGPDGAEFRYNDDGEPNASAGLPIFRQIEGRSITNVLVVVVRYYGGTKLGTGGLARAYGEAAGMALDLASVTEIIPRTSVSFSFSYDDTSPAMHVISQFDIKMGPTDYSEITQLTLEVRTTQVESFFAAVTDALSGRGELHVLGDPG